MSRTSPAATSWAARRHRLVRLAERLTDRLSGEDSMLPRDRAAEPGDFLVAGMLAEAVPGLVAELIEAERGKEEATRILAQRALAMERVLRAAQALDPAMSAAQATAPQAVLAWERAVEHYRAARDGAQGNTRRRRGRA